MTDKMREALEELVEAAYRDMKTNQESEVGGYWSTRTEAAILASRAVLHSTAALTKQEAGEEGYAPPIGTGNNPHGVVTVEAGEVSRSQTALEEIAAHIHELCCRVADDNPLKDRIRAARDCIDRAISLPAPDGSSAAAATPLPMLLFCPVCNTQHIDAPNPARNWTNPPHRSHECQFCDTIWRPADVATTGVVYIETRGRDDTWLPASSEQAADVAAEGQDKPSSVCTPLPAPDAGWRTINSAPKDGTEVLITNEGVGMNVSIGRYVHPEYRKEWEPKGTDWWRIHAGKDTSHGMRPSRWRPLPAPPVGDGSAPAEDSGPV